MEDAVTEGREVSAAAGAGLPRHAATGVVVAISNAAGAETGFRGRLEMRRGGGRKLGKRDIYRYSTVRVG